MTLSLSDQFNRLTQDSDRWFVGVLAEMLTAPTKQFMSNLTMGAMDTNTYIYGTSVSLNYTETVGVYVCNDSQT